MKKIILSILVLTLGLLVIGCGESADTTPKGDGTVGNSGSADVRGSVTPGQAGGGAAPEGGQTTAKE
jgi:hypothetical protein